MSTRFRQTFGSSVGAQIFSLKKSWNIQSIGLSSKKRSAWVMNCRRSSDLKSFPMKPSSENSKTIQGFYWFYTDFWINHSKGWRSGTVQSYENGRSDDRVLLKILVNDKFENQSQWQKLAGQQWIPCNDLLQWDHLQVGDKIQIFDTRTTTCRYS